MKINWNYLAAGLIAVAVVAYFVIRGGIDMGAEVLQGDAEPVQAAANQPITVVVNVPERALRARQVILNGRTEAARAVTVRSEVTGMVVEAPAREGDLVAQGDPLCMVDVEARAAQLAEAEAMLATRRLELDAANELADQGHRSTNQVAAVQAAYDAAEAAVTQAQIQLDHTVIRAPFDGVFDERAAEIGDFLSMGGACGVVAEMDPILIVAQAAERDVRSISVGDRAVVRLPSGQILDGQVRFVQFRAEDATRTFRVEVEAPNPDGAVRAGISAAMRLEGARLELSLVPTGVITLDAEGRTGVRIVDEDSVVQFVPVDLVEDSPDGSWVAGLDAGDRVIVRGQDFVTEGRVARATTLPAGGNG
ncbi:MAG: efflux RND transporter periplasmic adaptor subunit [Maricaulaceae bacterium]|jgi:multidrug efflux system membrane fusion protein